MMFTNNNHGRPPSRAGFTLVELLVVIAIIAILGALLVAFLPSVASQSTEANAAINLQGWLNMARQRAIRNQNPYGVRFVMQNVSNPALGQYFQVIECTFIEQPDDFSGGTISTSAVNSTAVAITGADPTGGFGSQVLYPVQPGDYLEILGTGTMHSITGVGAGGFTLTTPVPGLLNSTSYYRVLRAPRPIVEETLSMPTGVVVDLLTNQTYGNILPVVPSATGANVDVLFSPSGSVITSQLQSPTMNFWVRQPDPNNPGNVYYGTPTIIAVFAQTGQVGAFQPGQGANPYVDIH